jgi:oxygen-independent coproporphyrinogen-3 oxidase
MIALYLHVPFCSAICGYCNFNRGLFDAGLKARYLDAIEREIGAPDECGAPNPVSGRPADTIFFGGGTPSLLEPAEIARLIARCRETFDVAADAEITLETNPETATSGRLEAFRRAGITRLSFGVQSFDADELVRLGRIHSAERAREAVRLARVEGFDNVSLDLMFWLPGQSLASWLSTVDAAIRLAPDHLSLYLLELYPNAPLRDAIARAPGGSTHWAQAADDEAADMYLAALERLDAAGLDQYEISNVARPGRACRHNLKYWQEGEWRGFGCGAHSTVNGVRWMNTAATIEYVDRVGSGRSLATGIRRLDPSEKLEEALFTGLRLRDGVDSRNILARHGVDPWARYGEALAPFVEASLMWRDQTRFGLSRRGMLVANEILATFV